MNFSLKLPLGLCQECINKKIIVSAKGSNFLLCKGASKENKFPKYPALPVIKCNLYKPSIKKS